MQVFGQDISLVQINIMKMMVEDIFKKLMDYARNCPQCTVVWLEEQSRKDFTTGTHFLWITHSKLSELM